MNELARRTHFWRTDEDRTLRAFYPALGPKGCVERLPGRTYSAIVTRASMLELKFIGQRDPSPRRRWTLTPAMERRLRAVYAAAPVRGAVTALAAELGVPYWWLKRQAAGLGCARPQKAQPEWTPAEDGIVERFHGRKLEYIQHRLAAAGHHRSLVAIGIRRKRLGLTSRPSQYYTCVEIAKMLGVDEKTPTTWTRCGWLESARRRGSERTERQGGDMYWIHERELRAFILAHPHRIDLRKITDAEWFIRLVAGDKGDGRQHRRRKPGRAAA